SSVVEGWAGACSPAVWSAGLVPRSVLSRAEARDWRVAGFLACTIAGLRPRRAFPAPFGVPLVRELAATGAPLASGRGSGAGSGTGSVPGAKIEPAPHGTSPAKTAASAVPASDAEASEVPAPGPGALGPGATETVGPGAGRGAWGCGSSTGSALLPAFRAYAR